MSSDIKLLEALCNAESDVRGTSLITLYIPSGGNL